MAQNRNQDHPPIPHELSDTKGINGRAAHDTW